MTIAGKPKQPTVGRPAPCGSAASIAIDLSRRGGGL